jgi:glutathione synthase
MKIAFIVDPLAGLKAYKDSSIFMMREASRRGHQVFAFEARQMAMVPQADGTARVLALARELAVTADDANWHEVLAEGEMALTEFDAVLMRKDPPVDQAFMYATLLLSAAEAQGARIINRPGALRDFNEKLAITKFPQFVAPTLVTQEMARIQGFVDLHGDVIIKKLDGMGGTSIFRVRSDDANRNAIIEVQTRDGQETVMVQRYIPAIAQGDKRVLVINGKPAPFALARIPKAGETRGNLAAGGRGVAQPLSARDREIAENLGPHLVAAGLTVVGLDIIGDYLTEVNVTSPTCMVEIFDQQGFNTAAMVMDAIGA